MGIQQELERMINEIKALKRDVEAASAPQEPIEKKEEKPIEETGEKIEERSKPAKQMNFSLISVSVKQYRNALPLIIKEAMERNNKACLVNLLRLNEFLKKELKANKVGTEEMFFVDGITRPLSKSVEFDQKTEFMLSQRSLGELIDAIERTVEENSLNAIVFDSISILTIYFKKEDLNEFLFKLKEKLNELGCNGFFIVLEEETSLEFYNQLMEILGEKITAETFVHKMIPAKAIKELIEEKPPEIKPAGEEIAMEELPKPEIKKGIEELKAIALETLKEEKEEKDKIRAPKPAKLRHIKKIKIKRKLKPKPKKIRLKAKKVSKKRIALKPKKTAKKIAIKKEARKPVKIRKPKLGDEERLKLIKKLSLLERSLDLGIISRDSFIAGKKEIEKLMKK
ncbi:MAG: hypothetical protein AB1467_03280 [Candidatus Diapherotrites archaeon]